MTAKNLLFFLIVLLCHKISAQHDTIALKQVLVSDAQLRDFSDTQSVTVFNDSVIAKNSASLTTLLNYNSALYFKENGYGMVSSPSFRGTTAQQTAVIWNGININSQFNGQTDFNTINTKGFDNITIRAGGGSAIYGSSAIGGSVHLNNDLHFGNGLSNRLEIGYGSFNTAEVNYKIKVSNERTSLQAGITRNSSENDYEYLQTNGKHNENGQYHNTGINAAFGYKINAIHFLKLYSEFYEGERHFSGTVSSISRSKYEDLNSRNLLEWDAILNKWTSKVKFAILNEQYHYFENADKNHSETAKAETLLSKYDLAYNVSPKIAVNAIFDYSQTKGSGLQIGDNERRIGSAAFLFKHQLFTKLSYEFAVRQEVTNNYKSPLLFSFGTRFTVSPKYNVLVNVSRNFRIPTFNDLYWQKSGNLNLLPEQSYQAELGQQLRFRNLFLSATAYVMNIENMIQWTPDASGNWSPKNIATVRSYGAEYMLEWNVKRKNHAWKLNSNYGYTVSEDRQTRQQLIYVPFHKFTSGIAYSYKNLSADYQYLYNGYVFTSSDNYYFLKSYKVSNVGIDYGFGNAKSYKVGFRILNLWNENYQSVAQRPMPGRNFSIHLIFNF